MQLKFNHIGIAVPDLNAAIGDYRELFGLNVVAGPFADPLQRVNVCFLAPGHSGKGAIELVQAASPDSPVSGVLKRGGGAYHMCFETAELDEAINNLVARGCVLVGPAVPAVAFNGRRIAWIYTPWRQLIELLEQAPGR